MFLFIYNVPTEASATVQRYSIMAEKDLKTSSHSHNLEQYVLLAKSARGAGLVALINQTLEAPGVYVFGELIEMPSVKAVCICMFALCLELARKIVTEISFLHHSAVHRDVS